MAKASIRDRLEKLENKRRFLDWFVGARFIDSLNADELERHARDGRPPEPIPNRPSSLDRLDRKSLLKLWEEEELKFGGRSHEELDFYAEHGFWQEQKGRLHYSMQQGKLFVEWNQSKDRDHQLQVGGTNDIAKEA